MAEKITTIKLTESTKKRLSHLRVYKKETYEEIVEKMLDILNTCKVNPEKARAKLLSIDRQKRTKSISEKRKSA